MTDRKTKPLYLAADPPAPKPPEPSGSDEQLVQAAIADGRISKARAAFWRTHLAATGDAGRKMLEAVYRPTPEVRAASKLPGRSVEDATYAALYGESGGTAPAHVLASGRVRAAAGAGRPSVFASGDVPLVTASGADPSLLRRVDLGDDGATARARINLAHAPSMAAFADLLERYTTDGAAGDVYANSWVSASAAQAYEDFKFRLWTWSTSGAPGYPGSTWSPS